jgi:tRNA A22 N-methylase
MRWEEVLTDSDNIKQAWLESQPCELILSGNCQEDQIFQLIHNSSYAFHNEYWVREEDKKLYKQVIHVERIDTVELTTLATHCFIHKLMSEITAKSWKGEYFVRIELFKREMFKQMMENEIEKKTLMEA